MSTRAMPTAAASKIVRICSSLSRRAASVRLRCGNVLHCAFVMQQHAVSATDGPRILRDPQQRAVAPPHLRLEVGDGFVVFQQPLEFGLGALRVHIQITFGINRAGPAALPGSRSRKSGQRLVRPQEMAVRRQSERFRSAPARTGPGALLPSGAAAASLGIVAAAAPAVCRSKRLHFQSRHGTKSIQREPGSRRAGRHRGAGGARRFPKRPRSAVRAGSPAGETHMVSRARPRPGSETAARLRHQTTEYGRRRSK